ncbi:TolC family protein [Sodalis-like symbiont of Bactericera trigonica]|nr:TolC family protein [Sodalis-like symbiont of Bactericera trigonica]
MHHSAAPDAGHTGGRWRRLAAATARIGVAMADLYPKVTLGLSGTSAGLLNGIGQKDTYGWSLSPLISWTLPSSGAWQRG